MFQGLGLGIGLVLAGLVLVILVWAFLRLLPRLQPAFQGTVPQAVPTEAAEHADAVLIVQPGGRVEYINASARQWFDLREGEAADLERLARRVRPSEDFLDLCVTQGQARVSVNGRLAESTSYQVPGPYPAMLISLRRPEIMPALTTGAQGVSGSVLKIVAAFGQAIAASLDLEATLVAVLENVGRLVPADTLEVKVWDAANQTLIPYRIGGLAGVEGRFEQVRKSHFGPYADHLVAKRQPLFVPDTQTFAEVRFSAEEERSQVRSYIGIPLQAGGDLVGTLEVGQAAAEAFAQEDLDLLQLIAGQVAVAIRNALFYAEEQRRTAELTGLANLAQAVGALQDPKDLFARLVQSVAPLFDVEILGFIFYDESRRTLEGQVPFQGMPSHVVDIYRTVVTPDSPAEQILSRQEMILALDAATDEHWRDLGLQDFAQAASIRDSALAPLLSGGRLLGYLQLSNHKQGALPFSQDELRLASIIANQAAVIIDNAALVQQARQRAQRSEALRRIASLLGSSATADEILRFSVQELAHLLQADAAAVFLLDEQQGVLRAHMASLWGVSEEMTEPFSRLYITDPQYRLTVTGSQRAFLSGRLSSDKRVLAVYRPLVEAFDMESAVVVPLVVRERSLGELMLGSKKPDFFSNYDLQVVATAAGQLAAAIEASNRSAQTDESLRQRVDQLTALSRVSRELSATLELKRLLQVVYDEGIHATRADCGTISLFNVEEESAAPLVTLSLGCPLGEEISLLERKVLQGGEPLVVEYLKRSEHAPPHEDIRSALIVPIAYQGRSVGLIHLHAKAPSHFDEAAIEITQTLAVHAAIALGNAQRYQEQLRHGELLRRRADTLSRLVETSYALGVDRPLEQSLERIAAGIQEATPFQVVLVSVYEPDTGLLRCVTGVGLPDQALNGLKARKQPLKSIQQLLKPEFKIDRAYYIPHDQTPVIPSDVYYVTLESIEPGQGPNAWHPNDFLLFPLEDSDGGPLGLISLDAPRDGLRPDRATIESVEVFAAQTALTISNFYRLSDLKGQIEALSSGLQRQQRLLSVSQNDLPILLRKDLEQTISIYNLEWRMQRIRAGLAITESVSRQLDASSALLALSREILTELGMSVALVAENTAEGPRLAHVLGNVARAANPEALFGQRNPLRACLQTGETLLVMNLDEDDEWRGTALLNALHAKGFICLPLIIEGRPVAAVLAVSPEPMPVLTNEDRQVYFQIARQASLILQNISLLNETRRRLQEVNLLLDFSRQISGLDPAGIVNALLESALRVISVAHAGVVLLWDERISRLTPKAASKYADDDSLMAITYQADEALPGKVFAEMKAHRVDEVNIARDYALSPENLLLYRQATGGRSPVSSLLIPIQTGDRNLGVLLLDNFNTPAAFKPEDETLLLSLSQQVALSLENVRLMQATQERAGQLQALTDVAAIITSSLKSDELIASLLDQLRPVLPYDTAALWLRDKDDLSIVSARGFPDSEERIGLIVAVEDSALFNEMIRTGQGFSVADVRVDARFAVPAENPPLSWLGIPLISKGNVVGVIALEKNEVNFYGREHTHLVTTFASQAAVALENARLFEDSLSRAAELDQRSQRLASLNRFSAELSGYLDADQVLRLTAEELLRALSASQVSVVALDRGGKAILKDTLPKTRRGLPETLPPAPLFDHLRESLGVFTTDNVKDEPDLAPLAVFLGEKTTALLILPLFTGTSLHALLFVHMGGAYRFSPAEIELARTVANQASIALENVRLYQSTLSTAERLAILNQVSAEISASLEPEEIYVAIHKAAKRLMPVESFIIALLDRENQEIEGVYLMDKDKRSPNVRLKLGQGLSGRVIAAGEPMLIHGSEKAEAMGGVAFGGMGTPRSILAVPMRLGDEVLGMLSAQSYLPDVYTDEDQQILSTFANQAIVAIQNGRLFAETQRLAQELEQRVIERTAQLERQQRTTETLLRILTEVSSSLDLDRALSRTLAFLNESTGAEQGTIMLLHADDNLIHHRAGFGYLTESSAENKGFTLRVGEGLAGWVVLTREAILVDNLLKDPRWVKSPSKAQKHRSAIVAPLMVGEDVIGVLMIFHRKIGFFSPELLNMVKAIASQVAVAINNAHLYELIRDQAERLGNMLRKEQEDASRSQAILEAVADGVLVTDADNQISFLNTSAETILNLPAAHVAGQSLDDFAGLFGKAASDWMHTIRFWSEDPASHQTGETYAEQIELENGRVVLVHLAPVILQNDFLGTVSIFRDITHEVEVDRLKSEFVATVSHELRTPMTSIRGYVDILLMGAAGALSENQLHFLQIVRNNTERLNILVNDLLDVSRIEAGRVTLSPQPVDLREVAEDVVADMQRRSQEENKPMALALEAPAGLPRVYGDSERVRQILGNLVDNAYHYTPENGAITVRIHALNGSEVQVDVQDTGVGVAPDDQERIFERFYRGENPLVLATPGTGLGLSIVKQLVEMHNGRIWMKSQGVPGEGSTFSFTLPIYQSGDEAK